MKIILLLLLAVSSLFAGAEEDWAVIVSMDGGPARKPANMEEARDLAKAHFARHSALIEKFLEENPNDSRAFDARLRLAAIQAAATGRGGIPPCVAPHAEPEGAGIRSPTRSCGGGAKLLDSLSG